MNRRFSSSIIFGGMLGVLSVGSHLEKWAICKGESIRFGSRSLVHWRLRVNMIAIDWLYLNYKYYYVIDKDKHGLKEK